MQQNLNFLYSEDVLAILQEGAVQRAHVKSGHLSLKVHKRTHTLTCTFIHAHTTYTNIQPEVAPKAMATTMLHEFSQCFSSFEALFQLKRCQKQPYPFEKTC